MQYSHFNFAPFFLSNTPPGSTFLTDVYGVMSIFVPTALIMGTMLFAIRQWRLPFGVFTLVLGVNSTLMFLMRSDATSGYPLLLLVGPLAGLLADVLFRALNPSAENRVALRVFAFVVPFAMFLLYLFLLNLHAGSDGLWWQIHMWLGVPFQAGVIGLFLSFLVFPLRAADPV